MNKVTKLFRINLKSVDEAKRQVTFVFSNDTEDRYGEIVDQSTWDLKSYNSNPLLLWGHDPSIPENVLGNGLDLQLNVNGESLFTAQFDDAATNPRADMVYRQVVKGTLRTCSAGFIPHTTEIINDTPVLKNNELLEISIVPIPANPGALARDFNDGSLTRKDAAYLLEGMRSEEALLEKHIKKLDLPEGMKEKDMEELKAQLATLTEIVTKVAENQTSQAEAIASLTELVTPPEETEDEKTAREAQEAADQKAADDQGEADRIQAEADAANDGGDDQSGADDEELDLDSELTAEQLAEAEAAIAELEPITT